MKQIERFLKRKAVRRVLGDGYELSEQQANRLLLILDCPRRVKELEDWLPAFAHFIRNDLTNYIGRFRRLKKLPASPSLYSLVLRYGKSETLRRIKSQNRSSHLKNTFSYWLKLGLTLIEATEQVKRIQTERANKAAQVIRGSSEYSVRSLAYWLKRGFSLERAKDEVRRVQITNGIEVLRRKGHANPEMAQQHRTQQWLATMNAKDHTELQRINLAKTHSIEGCVARGLAPAEAEAASIAYYAKRRNFSQISQVCFDMVRDLVGGDDIFYKQLNYEKQFNGKNVDFFDKRSGIVIEFLGDFWHANPLFYDQCQRIYGKFACDIRRDDQRRFGVIESHCLVQEVVIVWESEFRKNPTEVAGLMAEMILEHRQLYV